MQTYLLDLNWNQANHLAVNPKFGIIAEFPQNNTSTARRWVLLNKEQLSKALQAGIIREDEQDILRGTDLGELWLASGLEYPEWVARWQENNK